MVWNFGRLAAGQHVKYTINVSSQGSTNSGWFTWDIKEAMGPRLRSFDSYTPPTLA